MRLAIAALTFVITACSANVPTTSPTAAIETAANATFVPTSAAPPPSPSATSATALSLVKDLSEVFRSLAIDWRPASATLLYFAAAGAERVTLVAQPIGPADPAAPPTQVVEFAGQGAIRSDGLALATSVRTIDGERIATYDIRSGASAWVTAPGDDPGAVVWSRDGSSLFYATATPGTDFKGVVHRVGADGHGEVVIAALDRHGDLRGLTPDGAGVILSRGQAGGSVDVLTVATGVDHHLADNASVASMRAAQPRLLLIIGGCCAGPGGGSLALWNDVAMTSREFAPAGGRYLYSGASWDPAGARIVAVRLDSAAVYQTELVTIDPASGAMQAIPDTKDASWVVWLEEGILFAVAPRRSAQVAVKLLPARGGAPIGLDKNTGIFGAVIVRP